MTGGGGGVELVAQFNEMFGSCCFENGSNNESTIAGTFLTTLLHHVQFRGVEGALRGSPLIEVGETRFQDGHT